MKAGRWPWVVLCSAALVLTVAALARAPYTPPGSGDAVLRLSWRMMVSGRTACRARTPEELAALPAHQRTPEVCEPDRAAYALVTGVGAGAPDTVELLRGGVKGDRPLFVLEERTLPAGEHRVHVAVHRLDESGDEVLASFEAPVTFEAGTVRLVTMDGEGRLALVGGGD